MNTDETPGAWRRESTVDSRQLIVKSCDPSGFYPQAKIEYLRCDSIEWLRSDTDHDSRVTNHGSASVFISVHPWFPFRRFPYSPRTRSARDSRRRITRKRRPVTSTSAGRGREL